MSLLDGLASRLINGWAAAFAATPRNLFLPNRIYEDHDGPEGALVAIDRDQRAELWTAMIDSDRYVTFQADDGVNGDYGHLATSSASQPSVVLEMLTHLDVRSGHSVLELGTGAGYNAALLAAYGCDVTTVEIDKGLAESADRRLIQHCARLGLPRVKVVAGDGGRAEIPGHYNRVIATYAVNQIPYRWVQVVQDGGVIVLPFGTAWADGALLRLERHGDAAAGRIAGGANFMWSRDQRRAIPPRARFCDYLPPGEVEAREGFTSFPVAQTAVDGSDLEFAVGLLVPQAEHFHADDEWLLMIDAYNEERSAAWVDYQPEPGAEGQLVTQRGPRNIADEVRAAYEKWIAAGNPSRERFGLTVTPNGQHAWLDRPDHIWAL